MKKIILFILLLLSLSCTRGSIKDTQLFLSSNVTNKSFEVKEGTFRVRIIASGKIKEGKVSIVLVDSNNNFIINEVVQEKFKFSRVVTNPPKGDWFVRGKFENGKGSYKIKIILE